MTKEGRPVPIIYNVAGGILRSFWQKDFRRLGNGLTQARFEGISALPFRVENISELYQYYFPPIFAVEPAWNPGENDNLTLALIDGMHGLMERMQASPNEPPLPQDGLFFPGKNISNSLVGELMMRNPQARYTAIDFNDTTFPRERTYVHAQSEFRRHTMTAEEVLDNAINTGSLLILDPTHPLNSTTTSYPGSPTHPSLTMWERDFNILSSRIAGIDLKPLNKGEISDLLKATGRLHDLAQAGFKLSPQLHFVRVEARLPITSQIPLSPYQKKGVEFLSDIVGALKTLRGD